MSTTTTESAEWTVRPDMPSLHRGFYIVDRKTLHYLNNAGHRQPGVNDADGEPNAFWPTREAAEQFLKGRE